MLSFLRDKLQREASKKRKHFLFHFKVNETYLHGAEPGSAVQGDVEVLLVDAQLAGDVRAQVLGRPTEKIRTKS